MSTARVRIVTDSACDLPQSVVDELGITVVPLTIRINDVEYVDREQLSVDQFWTACASSPTLPETAAPGSLTHFRLVGQAQLGERDVQSFVHTTPALKKLFPNTPTPPRELDTFITLGVKVR